MLNIISQFSLEKKLHIQLFIFYQTISSNLLITRNTYILQNEKKKVYEKSYKVFNN